MLNTEKILHKFLKLFTKFIPSGLPFVILRGPLKGYKIIMGAPAGEGKGISIIFNRSESKRLQLTKKLILKKWIIFDIGANVGIYSLLFSRYSQLTYAFEPFPRNLSYLYRMMKLNNVHNVVIVPCAVADKNGLSWFQKSQSYAEGRLSSRGEQPVPIISLDSFISESGVAPNLLKIDVEGAELLVLNGAKNYILKAKPIILLETHGDEIKNDCFEFLKKRGYIHFKPIDSSSIEGANDFLITT